MWRILKVKRNEKEEIVAKNKKEALVNHPFSCFILRMFGHLFSYSVALLRMAIELFKLDGNLRERTDAMRKSTGASDLLGRTRLKLSWLFPEFKRIASIISEGGRCNAWTQTLWDSGDNPDAYSPMDEETYRKKRRRLTMRDKQTRAAQYQDYIGEYDAKYKARALARFSQTSSAHVVLPLVTPRRRSVRITAKDTKERQRAFLCYRFLAAHEDIRARVPKLIMIVDPDNILEFDPVFEPIVSIVNGHIFSNVNVNVDTQT